MAYNVKYRADKINGHPTQEEADEIVRLAVLYKETTDELKEQAEVTKNLLEGLMENNAIASLSTDTISVTWTPPAKQKRISRDKVIEVLTDHGIPVDAIEKCYEEYDRKEVITIKKR